MYIIVSISCKVGQRHCSVLNFTKSILPNGACYTLAGDLTGKLTRELSLSSIHFHMIKISLPIVYMYSQDIQIAICLSLIGFRKQE